MFDLYFIPKAYCCVAIGRSHLSELCCWCPPVVAASLPSPEGEFWRVFKRNEKEEGRRRRSENTFYMGCAQVA